MTPRPIEDVYAEHFKADETVKVSGVPDVATNKDAILKALTSPITDEAI